MPLQTLLFSCLKFTSRWMRYAVKILEDFTEGNSRKSQKGQKDCKNHIDLVILCKHDAPNIFVSSFHDPY